MNHRLIL